MSNSLLNQARKVIDEQYKENIEKELLARIMVQNEILNSNLRLIKGYLTFFVILTVLSIVVVALAMRGI